MRDEDIGDRLDLFNTTVSTIEGEYDMDESVNRHLYREEPTIHNSPSVDFISDSCLHSTGGSHKSTASYLNDPILIPKSTPAKFYTNSKFTLLPTAWDATNT